MICAVTYENGLIRLTIEHSEVKLKLEECKHKLTSENLGNVPMQSPSFELYHAWMITRKGEKSCQVLKVDHYVFEDTKELLILKQTIFLIKNVYVITNNKLIFNVLNSQNVPVELFYKNVSPSSRNDSLNSQLTGFLSKQEAQRSKGDGSQEYGKGETVGLESKKGLSCELKSSFERSGKLVNHGLSENENTTASSCLKRLKKVQPQINIDEKTLKYLRIVGTMPSLFQVINNTVTKIGQDLLRKEICSPTADIVRIRNRQNFILENFGYADLDRLRQALKAVPNLETIKQRIEHLILNSGGCFIENKEKSQTINGTLDETTIGRMLETEEVQGGKIGRIDEHLGCIGLVVDLLALLPALEDLATMKLPGHAWLNKLLAGKIWSGIKRALHSTVNVNFDAVIPLIGDNRAFLIVDGKDEYLDLARHLYSENLQECQKLLLEIIKSNPECKIYKDGVLGVCLKVSNKCSFKTKNNFEDRLKSLEDVGFIILRRRKKYGLITTLELQIQNYKIEEVFIQIIEISGKICKRLLSSNCSIFNSLDNLIIMISESDVCLSHVVYSQQFSAVKPEIGDCIVIEHATNPLVPKSCFQDYFLSSFLNFNILTGQNMSGKSLYAKGLAYQIVLNQLGCFVGAKRASLPIFTGIYCIETVADINAVLSVLLNGRSDVLVIVDNLECSFCLQLTLAEVLLESGAIVIYITHCHTLPLYLQKYSNLNVIECVNYKVKDGLCKISNAEEICKDILPENVYKKWMNYRKLFYSKDLRL